MCWDHQDNMQLDGENVGQCGTVGAAQMAATAGVEKLVLVHRGPSLESDEDRDKALTDVRAIFDGEVILADELDIIDV
jgi:ribonuclease BN (tRNA processing enzyme)